MTNLTLKILNVALLIALLTLALSCSSGDSDNEPTPVTSTDEPGFGNSHDDPVGKPFALPAQIKLEGGHLYTPDFCLPQDSVAALMLTRTREKILGNPGYFAVCITLTNESGSPVSIRCPGGLTFISERLATGRPKTQNGIIISDIVITIPAYTTQSFLLDMYCLNSSRTRPAAEASFTIGPVTENPGMQSLITMLNTKNVRNDQVGENWIPVMVAIQAAVWDITADGAISQLSLAELEKL